MWKALPGLCQCHHAHGHPSSKTAFACWGPWGELELEKILWAIWCAYVWSRSQPPQESWARGLSLLEVHSKRRFLESENLFKHFICCQLIMGQQHKKHNLDKHHDIFFKVVKLQQGVALFDFQHGSKLGDFFCDDGLLQNSMSYLSGLCN